MTQLFRARLNPELRYHSARHTTTVVRVAHELALACRLRRAAHERLLLAAWFHDTGYVECYDGHEEVSQRLLEEFLRQENYAADFVSPHLIAVTHKSATPTDLPSELLKDADMNNLGTSRYFEATANLRYELAQMQGQKYTDAEWHRHCVQFMEGHRYYSVVGAAKFGQQKAANLASLRGQTV